MSALSEFDKSAEAQPVDQPKVSVIVPIRNEQSHIRNTLQQLLEQQLLDQDDRQIEVEILVADGRSTDRTREIVEALAKEHSHIKLFDNPGRLSSAARNIGVQHSTGQYVVIIDGHCQIPSRTYFVDLVDAFERTGADCLGRPQPLDVSGATPLQQAIAATRNSPLGHHPESYIYSNRETKVPAISVAVAYRREVFDRVGLFDPAFDACEDCEFNHRIDRSGLSCYLVPQLAVRYQPRDSLSGLFKQLIRYGRGRVRLFRKHRDSFSITSFIPAAILVGLVAGLIICLWAKFLWPVYLGMVGLYLLTLAIGSTVIAVKERKFFLLFLSPLVFATIHAGSGFGVILELLRIPARARR